MVAAIVLESLCPDFNVVVLHCILLFQNLGFFIKRVLYFWGIERLFSMMLGRRNDFSTAEGSNAFYPSFIGYLIICLCLLII